MSVTSRSRIAAVLVGIITACLVGILVLLPVHAFVSTWGGTAIGPLLVWKSWKEIIIAALVPLVIWLCFLKPSIARIIWARWYNKVVLAYVLLTVAWALLSPASAEAVIAGLLMNLRFLAMFVLAQVVLASATPWVDRMKHWLLGWLVATGAVLAVLALLQVTVVPKDFLVSFGYNKDTTISPYLLVDEDPNTLRAFATMRGPNALAAYLLLPLAIALLMWWQHRKNWWALGCAALITAGLFVTHSRSGWLGAAAMAVMLAFVTLPREQLIRWMKFGAIPALVAAGAVVWLAVTVPALRLVLFHSGGNDPTESLTEGSNDEHWLATADGLSHIAREPWGQGVGTAGPASFYNTNFAPRIPENYFVQIGQEVGLLGLALFITICVGVWRALWRQPGTLPRALLAGFVGVQVINLFLHGWADDPMAMTWWALAGMAVGTHTARKNRYAAKQAAPLSPER